MTESLKELLLGNKFLVRTVTYFCLGEVVAIHDNIVQLENASWVADTGRFSETIRHGSLKESEYVGSMFFNMDSVVDFFPWNHELPSAEK